MRAQLHSVPADPSIGCAESVGSLPRAGLRHYLTGYAGFRATGVGARRLFPLAFTTVIVDLAGTAGAVCGPRGGSEVWEQAGWSYGVAIGLTPAGAWALLGMPSRDLVDANLGLDALLGSRRAAELADRLRQAPDWPSRFAVLDERLASWLAPDRRADPLVTRAWWRLHDPTDRVTIGGLADELGVSRRRVELGFQRQVGLSPKTVARIARFQYAMSLLCRGIDGAALAHECGYADQAHFNREVREMAGVTPTGLFAFLQYSAVDGS